MCAITEGASIQAICSLELRARTFLMQLLNVGIFNQRKHIAREATFSTMKTPIIITAENIEIADSAAEISRIEIITKTRNMTKYE